MSNDPKKAGQLDPAGLKDSLLIVVSDPTIAEGPDKESLRIEVGQLVRDRVVEITHADSPFTAAANTVIYTDVSAGPIVIVIPAGVRGDLVKLRSKIGQWSINPVTLQCAVPMTGVIDDVLIDVDLPEVELSRTADNDYGWSIKVG